MLHDVLRHARDEGLHLFVEKGRLKYRARKAEPSAALRAEITEHKSALIDLLGQQARQQPHSPTLPRETGPLSHSQSRIFYQETAFDTGAAYMMAVAYRFEGSLDPARLEAAFCRVIERHHILRSRFYVDENGQAAQQVQPMSECMFGLEVATNTSYAKWRCDCEDRKCDPHIGEGIKASLLQHDGQSYLYIACHHIVFDGWSYGILFDELTRFYAEGPEADLPDLPLQYADYAYRQNNSDWSEASKTYWLENLAGVEPLNTIRTDFPRPARAGFTGNSLHRALPADATAQLRAFARASGVSVYSAFLAIFSLVIARYTRCEDCVIGTPVAGRNTPDLAGLIGFFAHVIPLRLSVDHDQNFRDLLAETQRVNLAGQRHQDLHFEQIIRELGLAGETAYTPLTQIVFTCDEGNDERLVLGDLAGHKLNLPRKTVNFELELHLIGNEDGGLDAVWAYADRLFIPETIEAISIAFETALASLVAEPDQPLHQHALAPADISKPEYAPYPIDEYSFADLFEAHAANQPEDIACRWYDADGTVCELNYTTLNGRANALARNLATAGAGPGDCVAVTVGRRIDTLTGMLAVQKLGAAYLVLDPDAPESRNSVILREANCSYILGGTGLEGKFSKTTLIPWTDHTDPANPDRRVMGCTPDDLTFVVFTSGSTGTPKGVQIENRALANLIHASRDRFGFHRGQCFAVASTLTFDAHLFEIYVALTFGGSLALLEPARFRNGALLATDQQALGIDFLFATPTSWKHLLEDGWHPRDGMTLLTGGEMLSATLRDQLLAQGETTRLINLYGPCEGTTYSLAGDMKPGQPVHAGHPLPNTSAFIRDRYGNPCPPCCPGELILGGAQIARGYLNGGEGFATGPQGRAYATGDIARVRANGQIEILGRDDFQTKINGVRIELGEVEAALLTHPAIDQAVAIAVEDAHGGKSLAVYLQGAISQHDAPRILGPYLEGLLPRGFLPSSYTVLDALPLTTSSKIDRKALPAPAQYLGARTGRGPENQIEAEISAIWSDLLGHKIDDIDAGFFSVGGHSLLAIKMLNQVNHAFSTNLAMRDVVQALTIAELARNITKIDQPRKASTLVRTEPQFPAPLSFAQERIWAIDRIEALGRFYTIPVIFDIDGHMDAAKLADFLDCMVEKHAVLRTVYVTKDGTAQQVLRETLHGTLNYIDASTAPDPLETLRQTEAALFDAAFDLEQGPVLRSALLKLDDTRHRWFIALHHIAFDGASLRIFLDELKSYFETGAPSAPETVSYTDYSRWQIAQYDPAFDLTYWTERLSDPPILHSLPTDHPRPPQQSYRGATLTRALSHKTSDRLRTLASSMGTTEFTALFTAFAAYLSYISTEDDIVIGTPVANRPDPALDHMIGCFVNSVPLRARLAPANSFRDHLALLHTDLQNDMAHQAMPFEKLVEALCPERSFAYSPLFQIMITVDNSESDSFAIGGAKFTAARPVEAEAKFDLTLGIRPGKTFELSWNYATDLFDGDTIGRMATEFAAFADLLVKAPDTPLRDIALDNLQAPAHGPAENIDPSRFAARFIQAANENPQKIAIQADGRSLTYAQVASQSKKLAELMAQSGVAAGALVGVHIDRSPEMIAALIAVHLNDCAYLPLDPEYPAARLVAIVGDARPQLVLHTGPAPDLPTNLLDIETGIFTKAAESHVPRTCSTDTGYVIYTSGSTGRPKGVEIGHESLCNFLDWTVADMGFGAADCVLQITSSSFDISVTEILAPLAVGGSIVIAPSGDRFSTAQCGRLIFEHKISVLQMVPGMLQTLVDGLAGQVFDSVTRLLCGGEAVPNQLFMRARSLFPNARLFNVYGPTEATVWASFHEYTGTDASGLAPIGKPMRNTFLTILNDQMRPVRQGQQGMLYIGGPALAKGYLGDPGRTNAAFLHQATTGQRLYKTGDIVRQDAQGNFLFLGRDDTQVKLHGYRIELGDIEAQLLACGASKAVCLVKDDALVAFVSADSPETLRDALATRLPTHMIPSQIVELEEFPHTPNGKIDRKALLALPGAVAAPQEYAPPDGETEETLAEIWQEVLERPSIGRHDNFFAIGGHSLHAIRIMSIITDMLEQEIPVRALFENQSIATFATYLENHLAEPQADGARQ